MADSPSVPHLKPGPRSPFVLGTRLAGLALAGAAWTLPTALALPLCCLGALSLLRVPRRRLLLELAALDVGVGLLTAAQNAAQNAAPSLTEAWAWAPTWLVGQGCLVACAALALATLAVILLAPEAGLLRLNGLDRYFLAQERPGCAMNSHHFVDTTSPLERGALERAVAALLQEVSLTRSFVREAALSAERFVTRRPWVRPKDLVLWLDEPVEPEWFDAPFDLARRPPLRLLCAPRAEGGFRLVLTIHHSAVDGTGGFLLLERLLQRYDEQRRGLPPAPPPPEAPFQRFRRLLAPHGLGWLLRMVRRHVRPMDKVGVHNASLLDDESPQPSTSRHHLTTISREAWDRLKTRAADAGRTTNDLLLAAALRAADGWRRERALPERPFRVLLPMDLRRLLGLEPCFQNFVGVVRAEFGPEEARAPELPRLVAERVRAARSVEEGIETPVNLGVLSALLPPPLFRAALRRFDDDPSSFFFSFLWSNVRIPAGLRRPPGTERIWIRGSLTRQPGLGVVVADDGEQVNLAFEYLEPLASEAGVRDLCKRLLDEIDESDESS